MKSRKISTFFWIMNWHERFLMNCCSFVFKIVKLHVTDTCYANSGFGGALSEEKMHFKMRVWIAEFSNANVFIFEGSVSCPIRWIHWDFKNRIIIRFNKCIIEGAYDMHLWGALSQGRIWYAPLRRAVSKAYKICALEARCLKGARDRDALPPWHIFFCVSETRALLDAF